MIEAGKKIVQVVENIQTVKSEQTKPFNFLGAASLKSDDDCLQILVNLENDAKAILSNLFTDINAVKAALDDFMTNIKSIPSVCLASKKNIVQVVKNLQTVKYLQTVKSEQTLNFLGESASLKSEDACLQILVNLENDAKAMISNLFTDISAVKVALDDFMANIKNIPNVCL